MTFSSVSDYAIPVYECQILLDMVKTLLLVVCNDYLTQKNSGIRYSMFFTVDVFLGKIFLFLSYRYPRQLALSIEQ